MTNFAQNQGGFFLSVFKSQPCPYAGSLTTSTESSTPTRKDRPLLRVSGRLAEAMALGSNHAIYSRSKGALFFVSRVLGVLHAVRGFQKRKNVKKHTEHERMHDRMHERMHEKIF